jgi:triacylglycerol lipase
MPYPIILAHGVCRFDAIWSDFLKTDNCDDERLDMAHYFKGVRCMLKSKGYEVFHSSVSWAASVDTRAGDLRRNVMAVLKQSGAEKVNIIAHSMGGLDARHMMFNDRNIGKIHKHLASLTTISTPHGGSPFADWGLDHVPKLIPIAKLLGLDLRALSDLTLSACRRYNQDLEVQRFEEQLEKEGIRIQTYAGRQQFLGVFEPLKVPFYIIEREEGENDGLVSIKSARWKQQFYRDEDALKEADHLNELGWYDPAQIFALESEDHLLKRIHGFYERVATELP